MDGLHESRLLLLRHRDGHLRRPSFSFSPSLTTATVVYCHPKFYALRRFFTNARLLLKIERMWRTRFGMAFLVRTAVEMQNDGWFVLSLAIERRFSCINQRSWRLESHHSFWSLIQITFCITLSAFLTTNNPNRGFHYDCSRHSYWLLLLLRCRSFYTHACNWQFQLFRRHEQKRQDVVDVCGKAWTAPLSVTEWRGRFWSLSAASSFTWSPSIPQFEQLRKRPNSPKQVRTDPLIRGDIRTLDHTILRQSSTVRIRRAITVYLCKACKKQQEFSYIIIFVAEIPILICLSLVWPRIYRYSTGFSIYLENFSIDNEK